MNKKQKQNIIEQINDMHDDDVVLHFLGTQATEFAEAIIGVTFTMNKPHVVYSYEKTIKAFMKQNRWTRDEAVEWFEYNVERGLPYYKNPPIFVEEVAAP